MLHRPAYSVKRGRRSARSRTCAQAPPVKGGPRGRMWSSPWREFSRRGWSATASIARSNLNGFRRSSLWPRPFVPETHASGPGGPTPRYRSDARRIPGNGCGCGAVPVETGSPVPAEQCSHSLRKSMSVLLSLVGWLVGCVPSPWIRSRVGGSAVVSLEDVFHSVATASQCVCGDEDVV